MKEQKKITEWYNKKTKLKNFNELKKLNNYIDYYNTYNHLTKDTLELTFSYDYKFEFYNLDNLDLIRQMKIRPESIFKLNFLIIIKKIRKIIRYFNNINFRELKLIIDFEKAGSIDINTKIPQATYKHDVLVKIKHSNNDNYEIKEIGLEYFEKIHDRIKDQEKKISSEIQLETYMVYEEKDKKYFEFIKNAIYEIFKNISSVLNDKYILTKIIYFQNYVVNKNIKQDTLIFNKILDWKKNNKFNFEEFFIGTRPINPANDKPFYDYFEFAKYLDEEHKIKIFLDNDNCTQFEYFIEIINKIDSEICPKIYDYRKTFTNMMSVMLDASDKIIVMSNKKSRLIRYNLPIYLDNLHYHIPKWKNKESTKNIYDALSKKM